MIFVRYLILINTLMSHFYFYCCQVLGEQIHSFRSILIDLVVSLNACCTDSDSFDVEFKEVFCLM